VDHVATELVAAANAESMKAQDTAGVLVGKVSDSDALPVVQELMDAIWGPAVVLPRNVLRALASAGSCVMVAERRGVPVGFALGFLGWDGGLHLHSHQVGVITSERGTGVGLALKFAQRALCLTNGVKEIRWTFDPILRANATFNLTRLGARIIGFYPNHYGSRVDAFNTGDVTDRVMVSWNLRGALDVSPSALGASGEALIALGEEGPHRSTALPVEGSLIPLPLRYHDLRSNSPALADAWRVAVGRAVGDTLDAGLTLAAIGAEGYVVGAGLP